MGMGMGMGLQRWGGSRVGGGGQPPFKNTLTRKCWPWAKSTNVIVWSVILSGNCVRQYPHHTRAWALVEDRLCLLLPPLPPPPKTVLPRRVSENALGL